MKIHAVDNKRDSSQVRFLAEMRNGLDDLHDQWSKNLGRRGGSYDIVLYLSVKSRIAETCRRLGIVIQDSAGPGGCDGERNGAFMSLVGALDAVEEKFGESP